jgi:4a-hydroxytetrahydrobiopterin dehydratase
MTKKDLLSRRCSPSTERTSALSQSEVSFYLNEVTGWSQKGVTIEKSYVFRDFKNAISFVNQVAEVAEKEDHHPDIGIYYNKIILTLWTHIVKGLTENDFILAAKIDAIS